ncbi:MAG: alpha-L-fucosidase, partial [Chitinophagaceae bacterium]
VLTTKHHEGFTLFDSKYTDYKATNTQAKRDLVKEFLDAFRAEGIKVGFYYSLIDWHHPDFPVDKYHPLRPQTESDEAYADLNKNRDMAKYRKYLYNQVTELLTKYGKIDILFIDGPGEGLREFAWQQQPDLVITRDLMKTPEQEIPDRPLPRPWEACYTMGTDWQYKPTNDPHKSGTEIINMLIEIRSKGGNLLMNVGPKPDGEIQIEQQERLREVALWNFVNREAIYQVKPLPLIRDQQTWFTQSNDGKTIYAIVTRKSPDDWKYGERKDLLLPMITANEKTKVSILGYKSELVEYKNGFDASLRFSATKLGLALSAVNGQRLYTNNRWPNAVVIKIENATFNAVGLSQASQSASDGAK